MCDYIQGMAKFVGGGVTLGVSTSTSPQVSSARAFVLMARPEGGVGHCPNHATTPTITDTPSTETLYQNRNILSWYS